MTPTEYAVTVLQRYDRRFGPVTVERGMKIVELIVERLRSKGAVFHALRRR